MLVSRLAPTPNGDIHWGNLVNFALTWGHIRRHGGKLWLRFDDIDEARCEALYADNTRTILNFLGLTWDQEYSNQLAQLETYRQFLGRIAHYVCDCSRQEIKNRSGDYRYDGHCRGRNLSYQAGNNAIRFLHPRDSAGDLVLWRREDLPAYHLTSVYDDWRMGINIVIRGQDLSESSLIQQHISATLPERPLQQVEFFHHRLITDQHGQKLSKSRQDGDLIQHFKAGMKASEFWRQISQLLGLAPVANGDEFLRAKWRLNDF